MKSHSVLVCVIAMAAAVMCRAQSDDATAVGQSVADLLRESTGADIAFVPAGAITGDGKTDLASRVQYPTDKLSVLPLTGRQVKLALERGVALFPTHSPAFLYVSGLKYSFNSALPPDARVSDVKISGSVLDLAATYKVAMPRNLAKGGLGFFTIWKRKPETDTAKDLSLENLLKGKPVLQSDPRWQSLS